LAPSLAKGNDRLSVVTPRLAGSAIKQGPLPSTSKSFSPPAAKVFFPVDGNLTLEFRDVSQSPALNLENTPRRRSPQLSTSFLCGLFPLAKIRPGPPQENVFPFQRDRPLSFPPSTCTKISFLSERRISFLQLPSFPPRPNPFPLNELQRAPLGHSPSSLPLPFFKPSAGMFLFPEGLDVFPSWSFRGVFPLPLIELFFGRPKRPLQYKNPSLGFPRSLRGGN